MSSTTSAVTATCRKLDELKDDEFRREETRHGERGGRRGKSAPPMHVQYRLWKWRSIKKIETQRYAIGSGDLALDTRNGRRKRKRGRPSTYTGNERRGSVKVSRLPRTTEATLTQTKKLDRHREGGRKTTGRKEDQERGAKKGRRQRTA